MQRSAPTLSKWESGQQRPDPVALAALAGLPAGLLANPGASIALLPTPRRETARLRDEPGEIIPF